MTRRWDLMQIGLALVAGLSIGLGFSGLRQGVVPLTLAAVLVLGAVIGEWLEVRIGPLGSFTLRPVLAYVGLWHAGPSLFMLVGLLPLLAMRMMKKGSSVQDSLAAVGTDAVALWAGVVAYTGLRGIGGFRDEVVLREIVARVGSFAVFWSITIPLQALNFHRLEGIRYRTALKDISQRTSWHIVALTISALGLSYLVTTFDVWVMAIAAVVLLEAYYPYKLLGEQDGVLLTSLQMMAQAVDLKDPYTSNHSQRVSRYAVRLARALGLPEEEVERIRRGGLMHDIGKIGISGRIIRKPGKLTAEERELMNRHSSVSAEIIQHLEIIGESAKMVRHHHEHCNGSGYPDGLKRNDIPMGSRIILVADAFDALTTDRPYRKGASKAEAIAVIRENAVTQFDPDVVDALESVANVL